MTGGAIVQFTARDTAGIYNPQRIADRNEKKYMLLRERVVQMNAQDVQESQNKTMKEHTEYLYATGELRVITENDEMSSEKAQVFSVDL